MQRHHPQLENGFSTAEFTWVMLMGWELVFNQDLTYDNHPAVRPKTPKPHKCTAQGAKRLLTCNFLLKNPVQRYACIIKCIT